jgi:Lon protease-like protein
MDLPVFALHATLFPGQRMRLQVFEERYRRMMEDVLPEGSFAVVAIREGREVGGAYEPYRIGVAARVEDYDVADEEAAVTYRLRVVAEERLILIEPLSSDPYPRWRVAPFPDEGAADPPAVEAARAELLRYLAATGEPEAPALPTDEVAASYALSAAAPAMVPTRQALLELPGPRERLAAVGDLFRRESALFRALGAAVGGTQLDVNPN